MVEVGATSSSLYLVVVFAGDSLLQKLTCTALCKKNLNVFEHVAGTKQVIVAQTEPFKNVTQVKMMAKHASACN